MFLIAYIPHFFSHVLRIYHFVFRIFYWQVLGKGPVASEADNISDAGNVESKTSEPGLDELPSNESRLPSSVYVRS